MILRNYILGITVGVITLFTGAVAFADHEPGHVLTAQELLSQISNQITNPNATSTPSISSGFSRDGVYGCTGASYGAVGLQGPTGAHVPTFDGAVHDQERLLTYKECLLDGIVNSMRETLISFIIKSIVRWTNQGFDGNPSYVTNLPLHLLENIADPEAERIIVGSNTDALSEPFRRNVRIAMAKYYSATTRSPESALRCELTDQQITALSQGDFIGAGGWETYQIYTQNPACNPLLAYHEATALLDRSIEAERERESTQLEWGSGFRTVEREKNIDLGSGQSTSLKRIVTPGFMIAEHLRQTIGTGLRQSENADEIDEIISALMANIGTEMLTDIEGLSGLSSSFDGQGSYIERLAQDSASRTRGNLTGAAASIVNNTIRIEQEYIQARQGSVSVLTQAKRQLESWESTCWDEALNQARQDLQTRVEARACEAQFGTSTCPITATLSEEMAVDAIGITVPTAGNISVFGRASQGDSIIDVDAQGSDVVVGPEQPTVITTGRWTTDPMDLSGIPDGTITVTALETLSGGGGTLAPITASVHKATTVSGIDLTPPATFPAITITASAGGFSESATFATSTARSRAVVNQNIKPILDLINENIARGAQALQVLAQIRAALESTTSASGQRFILERVDQLVTARVLHTEAQLRDAKSQALEIEGAMQQLLEETREGWEAGWCTPENWEQLTR